MKKVRLTEEDLHNLIENAVNVYLNEHIINEDVEEEGIWNQVKQGAKSFFGNGYGADSEKNYRNTVADRQARGEHTANWLNGKTPMNLKGRWNAAKTGFKQQGVVDDIDKVSEFLGDLVKQGKVNPEQTVGSLLQRGGRYSKGNLNQMRNQANSKISKANNDIYRGMTGGVMGSGRQFEV